MNDSKRFTVLEVVIVMIVLGAFASIVIPQFSQAATEAKISSLCRGLQEVRAKVALYRIEHANQMPGCAECSWEEAMTGTTVPSGELFGGDKQTAGDLLCGPYLERVPRNPYNGLNTVDVDGRVGDDSHGWHFDTATGKFRADDCREHAQL